MDLRRNLLLAALLIAFLQGKGQEMLGTVLGNYSGVNSVQLNPSAMTSSKTYLDIQILGIGAFVQNNYLYMDKKDYRISNFFKPSYQFPQHTELYGAKERMFYHYSGTAPRNAYINLRINGPGAMLSWGDHTFAITTAVRSVISGYKIPYDIANFAYLGLDYVPQQNINYDDNKFFNFAALTWAEIGIAYSYPVYAKGLNMLALGASIRRLEGMAGAYSYSNDANYMVPDDSTLIVNNADLRAGFALPLDYSTNEFRTGKLIKGGGFAGDIGITYTRLTNYFHKQENGPICSYNHRDYLYRIGLSVIDIGAIRFRTNAQKYAIDNKSATWTNLNNFDFGNLQHFMDTVSYKFYGDYTSAYRGDKIWVWLPAAVSVQFDYHIQKEWYVNGTVIYGFPIAPNSLVRPSEVAITPRYETSWFEADLPVSLYNWYLVRMGLALRFYYVTIGTDKLGWLFHVNDFTGMDFYIAFKFHLDKGICGGKKQKGCADAEKYKTKHSYR